MSTVWKEHYTAEADKIWLEFQKQHDLSESVGMTAGIDPISGRVWIGDSIQDVVTKSNADGIKSPLFFERVGSRAYYRKGARQ